MGWSPFAEVAKTLRTASAEVENAYSQLLAVGGTLKTDDVQLVEAASLAVAVVAEDRKDWARIA
jgi:hypothetical protein